MVQPVLARTSTLDSQNFYVLKRARALR